MSQLPLLVGLKVCKEVVFDRETDHVTLVHCIRAISAGQFPTQPQDFIVCCVLTGGRGELKLTLEISDASELLTSDEDDLLSQTWSVQLDDHLAQRWIFMRVRGLEFPKPGLFDFLLTVDGEWFAHTTLDIEEGDIQ